MMKGSQIYYKKVALRNSILLVGLPGIGNVGSLVGEHLKNQLKMEKLGTLYSSHFPHQVVMLKSGGVRLVSNRFYYWKNPAKGKSVNDIIVLIGDVQAMSSEGQYDVNEKVVKFFKKLKGKQIYTIGGYNASNQYIQNPRVFAVTTNKGLQKALIERGVVFGQASGMIWGSAGLILAFAKKYKIDATCLMGETGLLDVDANAAKAVLEILVKHLSLKVDLANIDKIRKETEKMLKTIEELNKREAPAPSPENLTYIR
jgi:uncharacterized protein (TIGR00162 family)